MEAIHAAAYHNNTLGLPLYAPEDASFTKEALEAHMKTFYTADRMVPLLLLLFVGAQACDLATISM